MRRFMVALALAGMVAVVFHPPAVDLVVAPVQAETACEDPDADPDLNNCEGSNPKGKGPVKCTSTGWSVWKFFKWVFTGVPC